MNFKYNKSLSTSCEGKAFLYSHLKNIKLAVIYIAIVHRYLKNLKVQMFIYFNQRIQLFLPQVFFTFCFIYPFWLKFIPCVSCAIGEISNKLKTFNAQNRRVKNNETQKKFNGFWKGHAIFHSQRQTTNHIFKKLKTILQKHNMQIFMKDSGRPLN